MSHGMLHLYMACGSSSLNTESLLLKAGLRCTALRSSAVSSRLGPCRWSSFLHLNKFQDSYTGPSGLEDA